jgi:hypothetical protein
VNTKRGRRASNSLLVISLLCKIMGLRDPKNIRLYMYKAYVAERITPEQANTPAHQAYWKAERIDKNSPMKLQVEGKDMFASVRHSIKVANNGMEEHIPR